MKHRLRNRVRFLSRSIHLLTLFVLLVLCAGRFSASPARATNNSFAWAKRMGGTDADYGTHVEVDSGGNLYSAGGFSGSVDFDPGPGTHNLTSAGNLDIFVSKLDKDGNLIWSQAMGGVEADGSNGLTVDSAGNVYTTGYFRGTADFDPGPGITPLTSAGNEDIFIAKLDSSGNFLWAKSLGGTLSDLGFHVEVDSAGNVYMTGAFSGTADFDPGPAPYNLTSVGNFDIFISKLDGKGKFLWAGSIGGVNSDAGQSLYLDASGGVYTTGYFEGPADFDPGPGTAIPTTAGSDDIFVSKLDKDGNFVWGRVMGGTGLDAGSGIAVDANGSVYTTGSFFDSADFDPGVGTANLTSAGNSDIFVSKLDSNGSFVWARGLGGVDSEESLALVLDASSNVYITGYFRGTADFDPGAGTYTLTSAGLDDIFVSKLDRDGNFVWGRGMGGTDVEGAASLALDASGSVYTTGDFAGTADFDPDTGNNLTSAGGPDIFIVKLQEGAIFGDVPWGYWARNFIERLSMAGITGGCATNPLRYCPDDTVTRAQMAVFLLRGIHSSSYTPPAVGAGTGFVDVPPSYWAAAFIKQLAAEGITSGCGSGNYCPENPVTRAQMAVFLLRSKHGAAYAPPGVGAGTGFGDVPPSYWAAAWIKQLVTEGITSGCGSGIYCPEQPVTRAQMAVFLVKTFNLP